MSDRSLELAGMSSKKATERARTILLLVKSRILYVGGLILYPRKIPGRVLLSNLALNDFGI